MIRHCLMERRNRHKVLKRSDRFSILRVYRCIDIRIVDSETDIKCMAKYDYALKRKKKRDNNMHMVLLSEMDMTFQSQKKNWHKVRYHARLVVSLVVS